MNGNASAAAHCGCSDLPSSRHCPVHNEAEHWFCIADPTAFWRSLTPTQALALLKAAPRGVATAWHMTEPCDCGCGQVGPTNVYRRENLASGDSYMTACVHVAHDDSKWQATTWVGEYVHGLGLFDTSDAAKSAADAALLAEGWVLE